MDYIIFHALNSIAGTQPLLDAMGQFFAIIAVILLVLMVFIVKGHRIRLILESACAVAGSLMINTLIGLVAFRNRPFLSHSDVHVIIDTTGLGKSFPSDHTAIAFALATVLYLHNRKWGIVAFIIALLIGVSRVYVGVHYPTDILGGMIVGLLAGLVTWTVGRHLISRR